eukprot:jgi/Picre1/32403/NNA_007749.t1
MAPFRSHLSKHLALLSRQWSAFSAGEEKERLVPLVSGLSERYLGPDYNGVKSSGGSEESINASMLPRLQKESFPLCMSVMMDSLRTQHHLKHTGRQQLGLFLKGIGLPMEEAILFGEQKWLLLPQVINLISNICTTLGITMARREKGKIIPLILV